MPAYKRYWQYVEENPDRYIVSSIKDGINHLKDEKTVYFTTKEQLREGYNKYSQNTYHIVEFAKGRQEFYSLILTKNSPLTPSFKKLAWKTVESGLRDALMREWFGPPVISKADTEFNYLSFGQTFLIFVVMFGSLIVSFLIYLLEILWKKWNELPNESGKRKNIFIVE